MTKPPKQPTKAEITEFTSRIAVNWFGLGLERDPKSQTIPKASQNAFVGSFTMIDHTKPTKMPIPSFPEKPNHR